MTKIFSLNLVIIYNAISSIFS